MGIHPKLQLKVNELKQAMSDRGWTVDMFEGYRSFERQQQLYNQGRTTPGKIVTHAKPGQGLHNYGLACFSDDTEILSENGWKKFADLDRSELVMVFKDGQLFYELPKHYISYDYCGEMVSIKTRSVDLLVTPNHKMIVKRFTTDKWDENWNEIEASQIDYKYKIPTAGDYTSNNPVTVVPNNFCDSETWWEFMGWYLSEGSCCGTSDGVIRSHNSRWRVTISQKENSKEWHLIKDCLDRMNVKYNYCGHDFYIHSKELHNILFECGNSYTKRIPRYLLKADKRHLSILLEALILGDGTHYEKRFTYFTVNELLANDVSELMMMLGYSCFIGKRAARESIMPHGEWNKSPKEQFFVNSRSRTTQELRNGSDTFRCITREEYDGKVYCVSTDAGAVVVKRNGRISISGNCDMVFKLNGKWSWDEKLPWDILGEEGENLGFTWGGRWEGKKRDRPHFQYTNGLTLDRIKDIHAKYGIRKVWEQI